MLTAAIDRHLCFYESVFVFPNDVDIKMVGR